MPTQTNERNNDGTTVIDMDIESKTQVLKTQAKSIGWNIKQHTEPTNKMSTLNCLNEVQVSHKQITDRFVELLTLFEDYSKIMESEQAHYNPQPKLQRSQSEQFTAVHMQHVESESSERVKATISLNRMQLSDSTLLAVPRKLTCEVSSQTSWTVLPNRDIQKCIKSKLDKDKFLGQAEQHTLHIEVESVTSSTALQRAPLRQRLWSVVAEAGQSLIGYVYMMGENFTYVLFVLLCLWCLYLIIAHYYSFLDSNISQQHNPKAAVARMRPHSR